MATLLLSHGAGGGVEARDLWALADALPAQGVSVVLFEQPWRVAGRKVATAPPTLDAALRCAADVMRVRTPARRRRSVGRRPLRRPHGDARWGPRAAWPCRSRCTSPGGPSRPGSPSCSACGLPTLVVQGERDPMGRPEEFPGDLDGLDVVVIPGGDHGLKVPARGEVSQDEAMGIVVESTLEWLVREVVGNPRRG